MTDTCQRFFPKLARLTDGAPIVIFDRGQWDRTSMRRMRVQDDHQEGAALRAAAWIGDGTTRLPAAGWLTDRQHATVLQGHRLDAAT
jgi:hypothetical protein